MTTTTVERSFEERWEAIHQAILAGPGKQVQEQIDSGQAWRLEGSVGRKAMAALRRGAAVLPQERGRDFYGHIVPSCRDVVDESGSTGSVTNSEDFYRESEEVQSA